VTSALRGDRWLWSIACSEGIIDRLLGGDHCNDRFAPDRSIATLEGTGDLLAGGDRYSAPSASLEGIDRSLAPDACRVAVGPIDHVDRSMDRVAAIGSKDYTHRSKDTRE
jgi:hypothetical protein